LHELLLDGALYRLDRLPNIVRGEPPGQENARSLGYFCGELPINYFSSASIGLIGEGVQHESPNAGPATKLRQGEKRAPIFHAKRFEERAT
jgi:hypothetical protein